MIVMDNQAEGNVMLLHQISCTVTHQMYGCNLAVGKKVMNTQNSVLVY